MKDCPRCEAPLHDHESVCPRCGEKQIVSKSLSDSSLFEQKSTMNPVPVIVVIVLIIAGLGFAAKESWIGQLLARGPVQADPMDSITPVVARQLIEEKITANLASVGATGKFEWKENDGKADKNSPLIKSCTLDIETALKDPKGQHDMVVEPAKAYMDKGNVRAITMNDVKAHATWTYTLAPPAPTGADGASEGEAPPQ